jgi:chromosome partitioning protein
MLKIVVLNPKGGSGKTTVATNLAAGFATRGERPALMDLDPQGSTTYWLKKRSEDRPPIHGIVGFGLDGTMTRSWQLRVPPECTMLITDTAAALQPHSFGEITRGADAVLVPVMPSDIDIHAAAKCIADLLLVAKVRRSENRIGIIANRVKSNTLTSQALMRFLNSLDIPLVATLRDSQNYVRSTETGIGVQEMPAWQAKPDHEHWQMINEWLDSKRANRPPAAAVNPAAMRNY